MGELKCKVGELAPFWCVRMMPLYRLENAFNHHGCIAFPVISTTSRELQQQQHLNRDNIKCCPSFQQHKWRFLNGALSQVAGNGLEILLRAIKNLEQSARKCYSEIIDLDSNEFALMMVLDGCFILEILIKETNLLIPDSSDPIFTQPWFRVQLIRDFLMLENQVPFFVLQCLFDLMAPSMRIHVSLKRIALCFFAQRVQFDPVYKTNPKHLLHLIHSNLLPKIIWPNKTSITTLLQPFPCATQLREVGVKFKRGNANNLLDIKFEDGVIEMPTLSVQDSTNSLLLNLIAFEQCYPYCSQHIRAYTFFIDCLINSTEDVQILFRSRIIENWLGTDVEVADLFNKLGRDIPLCSDRFYQAGVFESINRYCNTPWHAWCASLMHKYFFNPWAIFSLIGALILLFLTLIQTIFSAYSYSYYPS